MDQSTDLGFWCILEAMEVEMKLHPRERIVSDADREIQQALLDIGEKYNLTYAEYMMILSGVLAHITKYEIRWERHGDMEKEGGLK